MVVVIAGESFSACCLFRAGQLKTVFLDQRPELCLFFTEPDQLFFQSLELAFMLVAVLPAVERLEGAHHVDAFGANGFVTEVERIDVGEVAAGDVHHFSSSYRLRRLYPPVSSSKPSSAALARSSSSGRPISRTIR